MVSEIIDWGNLRRLDPFCQNWGFSRGTPIDRYYIYQFLSLYRNNVKGRVLEIKDRTYTEKFGQNTVELSDVLDIDPKNRDANIIDDLTTATSILDEVYDCFILTQTLNIIYDFKSAIRNACRILTSGGILLGTVSAINRISSEDGSLDGDYWRFTHNSIRETMQSTGFLGDLKIHSYGNLLSCTAFLFGIAFEELTKKELNACDPYYPLVYGFSFVKK